MAPAAYITRSDGIPGGAPFTPVTVLSLALPAGSYLLVGRVTAYNGGGGGPIVQCDLTGLPSSVDQTFATVSVSPNAAGWANLVLEAADTLPAATTVSVVCQFANNVGPVLYERNVLTAIEVDPITVQS